MKTQIFRIAFITTVALLIAVNNNASKLEISKFQTSSIAIEAGTLTAPAIDLFNDQPNHNAPDIHFHIFDINKDDRILKIWKIKTRAFSVAFYDLIFLTGLHYALFILPFIINNH